MMEITLNQRTWAIVHQYALIFQIAKVNICLNILDFNDNDFDKNYITEFNQNKAWCNR